MPSRSSIVPAFVEPALATTANGPAGIGAIERRRERGAGQAAALVVGDREQVDVHHARRRRHRRVHGVGARDLPTRRALAASAVGGGVARRDQGREVARRPARDEAAAGPGGHPRELGEPSEHLVLRPHGARRPRASSPRRPRTRSPRGRRARWPCSGAPGTNARKLGWSVVMVAGASTSAQIRSASSPPIPSGVIVGPAAAVSSSGGTGWSSGCGSAMRRRV